MKNFFITCVICILVKCAFALTPEAEMAQKDLVKVNEVFKKYTDLSMHVYYSAYEDYYIKTPQEKSEGDVYKHNDSQYSELLSLKTLNTKDYLIVVDTSRKQIMIGNPVLFDEKAFGLERFDMLLKKCKKVSQTEIGKKYRKYKLELMDDFPSEYAAIDVVIDYSNYFIYDLVYYYRREISKNENDSHSEKTKPRLEINFRSVSTKSKFPKGIFNESRFIQEKNQQLVASKMYKDYQVINNKISKK